MQNIAGKSLFVYRRDKAECPYVSVSIGPIFNIDPQNAMKISSAPEKTTFCLTNSNEAMRGLIQGEERYSDVFRTKPEIYTAFF